MEIVSYADASKCGDGILKVGGIERLNHSESHHAGSCDFDLDVIAREKAHGVQPFAFEADGRDGFAMERIAAIFDFECACHKCSLEKKKARWGHRRANRLTSMYVC